MTTEQSQQPFDHDPETYAVIGAAMEVHRQLGPGFLEAVYQEALAQELTLLKIPFRREAALQVFYKGVLLPCSYRADFLCFANLLVETKALDRMTGNDSAQVLNYLKATNFERGLLLNFGAKSLETRRFINKPTSVSPL